MLSIRKLKFLIKDEKQAAKFYQKHGLPELAEDERKHRRILMRKLKKRLRR
jgi:rubrerythrin